MFLLLLGQTLLEVVGDALYLVLGLSQLSLLLGKNIFELRLRFLNLLPICVSLCHKILDLAVFDVQLTFELVCTDL